MNCCCVAGGSNVVGSCGSGVLGCGTAMTTVNPTPGVCQTGCNNAGGISCLLNTVGKWGSTVAAQIQNKPVVTSKSGVAIGATGTSLPGQLGSNMGIFLIIGVVIVVILLATKR